MSMVTLTEPNFYHNFPSWTAVILHSGITLGSLTAVILNLLFNGVGHEEPVDEED